MNFKQVSAIVFYGYYDLHPRIVTIASTQKEEASSFYAVYNFNYVQTRSVVAF